ncbi:MAG: HD-GYP domain-containing protein [Clostridia bacterium]|jgi:response regulator receiver modulated metal dependent phosphohydrolase|nr:HD domain-containing protein [Clostridium sp.]MEE0127793.1 HD domain-containing protein [Clostridia bacterium]HJJ11911.1 HD domain-containing protein [Clostridiaceae bacterium]
MRKNQVTTKNANFKVIAVDDEQGILDSLSIFMKRSSYDFVGITDPIEAIDRVKTEHFDLMILDFIMDPIHGDKVVEEIRKFNKDLYILLLTGHKDLAPPLETIHQLDIQGYCEKSDKFDQLLLLIESALKSVNQMRIINKMNDNLKNSYMDSIEILRHTVEAKDPYTKGHSDRVSQYAVLLGKKLNLPDDDIEKLKIGGLFHDIGKIGIPDSILLKESKLTDEEYTKIKDHPLIGYNMLAHAEMFKHILDIIKYHHERFDGSGYPEKLEGINIPYLARITSVVDSFDAMTSKRSYRDSLPMDVVKSEILKNLGVQFDPEIGIAFLDILDNDFNSIKQIQEKY